jgi:Spy/CpxP family protein refolding chaperone
MKLVRSIAFSLSLAGSAAAIVACGGSVEHSPQTSASAATKAPIGTNTHGLVKVVGDALGEVPLRPEQRTEIEKLAQDAEARHVPIAEKRKTVALAFADQVEKGAIDRTALQPSIDAMTADMEKAQAGDRAAIGRLHAILDPEQRGAFVDALERAFKAKHGEHGAHGGKHGGFAKMKALADDLKLTDAQKTQIHDIMRDSFKEGMKAHRHPSGATGGDEGGPSWHVRRGGEHGEAREHHGKHGLEAFREDKLDLDKTVPTRDTKAMTAFGANHATSVAEKVLPILTPEQRKIAAEKLRAAAASGEGPFF